MPYEILVANACMRASCARFSWGGLWPVCWDSRCCSVSSHSPASGTAQSSIGIYARQPFTSDTIKYGNGCSADFISLVSVLNLCQRHLLDPRYWLPVGLPAKKVTRLAPAYDHAWCLICCGLCMAPACPSRV